MPMQQGSSEDIREPRIHFDAEDGYQIVTEMNSYGDVTKKEYLDGATKIVEQIEYYASFKILDAMSVVGNWTETGDGALSVNTNGWLDGTTDVLRNTYTFSGGTSTIADSTTNHGDLSNWIGASCDQGYVTILADFSDFSNVTSVECRIGSSSADYRSVILYSGVDYTTNDRWFGLIFDLSAGSSTGTPLGTAVDYVAFIFTIAAGTSQTIDMTSLMVCKENSTKISGEDFYDIRRETREFTSESKIYEYEFVYDAAAEESYYTKITGGY